MTYSVTAVLMYQQSTTRRGTVGRRQTWWRGAAVRRMPVSILPLSMNELPPLPDVVATSSISFILVQPRRLSAHCLPSVYSGSLSSWTSQCRVALVGHYSSSRPLIIQDNNARDKQHLDCKIREKYCGKTLGT